MSKKKKRLREAREWCYCEIHKIKYLCVEGCPKCARDWSEMILYFSVELMLLILILVYLVLAIMLGLVRGWNYLKKYPVEKTGRAYHWHNERITFTYGFSLTALALFLSIQFRELAQISSTLIFFSTAFTTLILSSIFIRFRIRNFFLYLSDVLLNTGMLSIGCGFLVFFTSVFAYDGSTIVFIILVIALFVVSLVNYFFFDRYTEYWREGEKRSEQWKIRKREADIETSNYSYLSEVWREIHSLG